MSKLIIRLVINAVALWVASRIVPGIYVADNVGSLLFVALIFGIINALIKPVIQFFTCPFYVLTLGLFTFIVNALMLLLTSYFSSDRLGVNGFGAAFFVLLC